MVSTAEILRQRLPAQDLGRLTLVSHQPKKLKEWVAGLPMINVGETSRQVFQTLQELNRLQLDAGARIEALEILRPVVHSLADALAKHYLNQSVSLPERATKVATLAQSMQSHLATGYKLAAVACLERLASGKRDVDQVQLAALVIHRAITELTGNLLRSTQLYLNTPSRLWLELHSLYLGAVGQQIALTPAVADPLQRQVERSSVEDVYKRALLLATCKPNKLRQSEIAQIHLLGELWAPLVTLRDISGGGELFVFDLSKDAPPTYRSLAQAGDADHVRAIDPSRLVDRLGELKRNAQASMPKGFGEGGLSLSLLEHLIQAWSELSERSFSRVAHDGRLEACIGLTALHYFLSGSRDFETMMRGDQGRYLVSESDNPFLRTKQVEHRPDDRTGKDVWSLAFGGAVESKAAEFNNLHFRDKVDDAPRYDTYSCQIVNISPGGYCLQWSGEVPSGVRAGEILGLREDGQANWSIGVIRWVKQLPGQGAQLGIEVLSPKAKPCGARVIKKTGEATEYMRTLLLPELKTINRPATLITPALTFRTGYKVGLNLDGEEVKTHMAKQLSATPSFCQFEFSILGRPGAGADSGAVTGAAGDEENFDSIWSSL
ncbi:MAG: hypothetical protein K0S46_1533 [Moraxellaceae bacterium]|jgi:hypothetical protein|nr:hypothetical protein [Moraxellaceae bacterium]